MNLQPVVVLTEDEKQQINYINQTANAMRLALVSLPDHIKEHIKYEIEVFNNETNYLRDVLESIA